MPHIDAKPRIPICARGHRFCARHIGSENHKKLERYIVDHLKGDQVEDDAFVAVRWKAGFQYETSLPGIRAKKMGS